VVIPGWRCGGGGRAYVRSEEANMQLWLVGEETHDDPALGLRSVGSCPAGVVPVAS